MYASVLSMKYLLQLYSIRFSLYCFRRDGCRQILAEYKNV